MQKIIFSNNQFKIADSLAKFSNSGVHVVGTDTFTVYKPAKKIISE